jgi:Hom_end-associated Hint/Tape measure protein
MPDTVFNFKSSGEQQIIANLVKLQKQFQDSTKGVLELSQALGKNFSAANEFAKSIGLSGDKAAAAVRQLQALNGAGATTQDRFNALNKGLGITAQQFLVLDKAVGEYNKEQERLKAVALQTVQAEKAQAAELKKLAAAQKEAAQAAKEGTSAFSSFLQGIGQGVGIAALQAFQDGLRFIVDGLRDFVVSSVEAARRLTDFTNTLTIVTGSSAGAAAELAKIRAVVDELSLPLEASIEGFTKLTAAAAGTSFEGAGVEKIFRGVSDAASALGLSSDKVNGAFLALEQIISKGCHAKGTLILMADGSVKAVETIEVGDQLLGPDNQAREVLSLARGVDFMYKITPSWGNPFVVNLHHKLRLIDDAGDRHTVKLKDYLSGKEWSENNFYLIHSSKEKVQFQIESQGKRQYFGFLISGDHLYYDAQGFEHHNSVQAEELRGQLGERIPGAFNIFADSLGVTTAELNDLLKAGQVGSDALIGFSEELTRRFGGQALDSPTKALNRLQTSIFDIQTRLGTAIQPAFTASLDAISSTLQKTAEQTGAFDIIGAAAQRFADTLKENPQIIDDIAEGLADIANLLAANIADVLDFISTSLKENPNLIREFIAELKETVSQLLVIAENAVRIFQIFGKIGNATRDIVKSFADLLSFQDAFKFLAGIGDDVRSASTGFSNLEEKVRRLDLAAQGVGDTFGGLSAGIGEAAQKQTEEVLAASDAFEAANEAIATSQTQTAAELAKAYADGIIDQEEFNRQTAANDEAALDDRIARLQARRDELTAAISPQDLASGTSDTAKAVREQLAEINSQIAQEDLKLQQQRIKSQEEAQKAIEERQKETLEKLKNAYEDADRAIEESTQTRILNIARLEATGDLSAEDAALERVKIEQEANEQQIANVAAREAEINAKIQSGQISREDGEKELDSLNDELSKLRLDRIQREIDAIEAQKAIAIAAINERKEAATSALDAESTLNDIAASGIQSQLSLLEARNGILEATSQLEQSRLENAIKIAEEEGKTNEVTSLRNALFAAQRRDQERQIAQKRQELKLQQELLATQNESKRIAAEIAVIEAQTAIETARVNGASDEQIARLERILELRRLQLGAVQESGKAEEAALALKGQQLDAEARLTREKQQQAEEEARRQAEANKGSAGGAGGGSGGDGQGVVFSGASLEALNKASESLRRINESLDANAQAVREIQLSNFDPVLIQQLLQAGFEEPVARAFENGGQRAADAVKQQLETIGFENAGGSFSQGLTVDVSSTLEKFGVQVESVTQGLASLDRAGQDAQISLSSLSGARFPGRKTGGDVKGGKPVIVGEAGPEVYVPGNDGWIINHTWTKRLLSEEKRYSLPAGGALPAVNAQLDSGAITNELRVLQQQNKELVRALTSKSNNAMQMTNYWQQAKPPSDEILDLARRFLPKF